MKSAVIATLSAAGIAACGLFFPNSATACFFPFWPGCWGGGYGYSAPAPVYGGGYSAGYGSGYGGTYGAYSPVWSTSMYYGGSSYAPSSGCCVPSGCDPCGNACGSGGCGTGSCAGTSGDSLKPAADPDFGKKKDDLPDPLLDDPLLNDRDRSNRDSQEFPPRRSPGETYERDRDPLDDFGTPSPSRDIRRPADTDWSPSGTRGTDPAGGSGTGRTTAPDESTVPPVKPPGTLNDVEDDGLFPAFDSPDPQRSNKPPMTDPLDPSGAAPPADSVAPAIDPFVPPENKAAPAEANPGTSEPTGDDFLSPVGNGGADAPFGRLDQSSDHGTTVQYGSQLREVLPSQRLAARTQAKSPSQLVSGQKTQQHLRWISVPRPISHAQL